MKIESVRRRLFGRAGMVAGVAAVAGLAVTAGTAAFASSSVPSHHASGPRPTIVLVHGAWANGASWDGVVQRLQRDGYTVDVPPNPLQGLAYDPAFLADFLHTISGPIVLVGHSYGGAVITNAATGDTQVKAQWPCVKALSGIVAVSWHMMVLRGCLQTAGCRTGSRSGY